MNRSEATAPGLRAAGRSSKRQQTIVARQEASNMADTPFFSVGGLASGLDTSSIIEGLTKLEQRPLDTLRAQQEGFRTQISLIGQLVGKIKTLQTAAQTLADSGTVGMKTTSTNTDFTATGTAK